LYLERKFFGKKKQKLNLRFKKRDKVYSAFFVCVCDEIFRKKKKVDQILFSPFFWRFFLDFVKGNNIHGLNEVFKCNYLFFQIVSTNCVFNDTGDL